MNKLPEYSFFAGDSVDVDFIITENNIPQDVTGFSAKLKLSPLGDNYKVLEKNGNIDSTVTGRVYFNLVHNDTKDLEQGYYCFQMTITQGTTLSYTIEGNWHIKGVIS